MRDTWRVTMQNNRLGRVACPRCPDLESAGASHPSQPVILRRVTHHAAVV